METFLERIITSAIIITVSFIIYFIVKKIINGLFAKRVKKAKHKKSITIMKVINNIIRTIILILAVLTIISVWGVDTKALIASLGIVGLVAGLAVQDTLKDVIAGAAIIFEDEFDVGDNIQIGTFRGDVIDVGLQNTVIRAYTGEIKIIANRNINEVINYSRYSSIALIDFGIAYNSEPEKVKVLLDKICEEMNKFPYLISKVQLLGIQELSDDAVTYRIYAECKPGMDFPCKRDAWQVILRECQKANIDIPFKQVVIHDAK